MLLVQGLGFRLIRGPRSQQEARLRRDICCSVWKHGFGSFNTDPGIELVKPI